MDNQLPAQTDLPVEHAVTLSLDEWKNVLAAMEAGVKAIGASAFVLGGTLIEAIAKQLNAANQP